MNKLRILGLLLLMCSTLFAKEPSPPLEQASTEQQKSISQLVCALKEVRKAIFPPGQPAPPQVKKENPFKDKQEYKNKPPESEMQKLAKQQQEIIDKLKEQEKQDGAPEDLAGKQQGISGELKKLAENEELAPSVRQAMQDAAEAGDKTAEAMKNAAGTEAKIGAQKTLAKIKQAMQELGKDAQQRAEEALDEAAQKLAEAEQARKEKDGKQAGDKAGEAEKILDEAAQHQKQAGGESAEKTLAELAKKMRDGELAKVLTEKPGEQAAADQLAEMREAVARARQGDKTAREEMEEAMQALKDLQKEMQYEAKHPEELTDDAMRNMLSQANSEGNRIGRSQSQMSEQGQGNGSKSSMESDVGEVERMATSWSKNTKPADREIILYRLIELTGRILVQAQQTLDPLEKETVVRNLAKDEVPEKYQTDVATYFKRLSEPDRNQP